MPRESPTAPTTAAPIDIGALLDEGRWSRPQKFFVSLTALMVIFDGIDNQLLSIALPSIMQEWSLSRVSFAPVLAGGTVGMAIGGATAGIAGDRFGRRFVLIASVLAFGVLTAAVSMADGLWTLGILRFLAGLGLGGAMPNAAALASEYVPRRDRPVAVTVTIVCVPVGGALAAFVAGRVLPATGWRAIFAIGGMLPVVVAIIVARMLPESPRYLVRRPARWPELLTTLRRMGHDVGAGAAFTEGQEGQEVREGQEGREGRKRQEGKEGRVGLVAQVGALFARDFRGDTLALWGAFFFCMLAVYSAFNWVPSMLTGAGLGLVTASNGLTAFNLGGVAGAIGGGLLIARLGSRSAMLAMSAGSIAGAAVLAFMPIAASQATAILVMLGITGALINAVQTTMYALAAHVYPTKVRATGVGSAVAVGRLGAVLSTYAGAFALELGGSAAFFVVMAVAMTLVLAALALIVRHVPRTSTMTIP